jgi:hypothetical protein
MPHPEDDLAVGENIGHGTIFCQEQRMPHRCKLKPQPSFSLVVWEARETLPAGVWLVTLHQHAISVEIISAGGVASIAPRTPF